MRGNASISPTDNGMRRKVLRGRRMEKDLKIKSSTPRPPTNMLKTRKTRVLTPGMKENIDIITPIHKFSMSSHVRKSSRTYK
jgi:hypothetical protein